MWPSWATVALQGARMDEISRERPLLWPRRATYFLQFFFFFTAPLKHGCYRGCGVGGVVIDGPHHRG